MDEDLYKALAVLSNCGSSDLIINGKMTIRDIEPCIEAVVSAIRSDNFDAAKNAELEELDRILKWELLGAEEKDFNWESVSWIDVEEAAKKCQELLK